MCLYQVCEVLYKHKETWPDKRDFDGRAVQEVGYRLLLGDKQNSVIENNVASQSSKYLYLLVPLLIPVWKQNTGCY